MFINKLFLNHYNIYFLGEKSGKEVRSYALAFTSIKEHVAFIQNETENTVEILNCDQRPGNDGDDIDSNEGSHIENISM